MLICYNYNTISHGDASYTGRIFEVWLDRCNSINNWKNGEMVFAFLDVGWSIAYSYRLWWLKGSKKMNACLSC